ncbi:hypothetical protein D3C86_2067440 [compost metagenome]
MRTDHAISRIVLKAKADTRDTLEIDPVIYVLWTIVEINGVIQPKPRSQSVAAQCPAVLEMEAVGRT